MRCKVFKQLCVLATIIIVAGVLAGCSSHVAASNRTLTAQVTPVTTVAAATQIVHPVGHVAGVQLVPGSRPRQYECTGDVQVDTNVDGRGSYGAQVIHVEAGTGNNEVGGIQQDVTVHFQGPNLLHPYALIVHGVDAANRPQNDRLAALNSHAALPSGGYMLLTKEFAGNGLITQVSVCGSFPPPR